jgi:hypothetical protein
MGRFWADEAASGDINSAIAAIEAENGGLQKVTD